jgi:hypothetical protein
MRRTGVIPPGKAGLVMLAVAFVPVAIKACKPLVRAIGRGLKKAGEAAERVVDNSQIAAEKAEPVATTVVDEPKAPKKSAKKNPSKKKSTKPA